jgi:hypothetical protein
MFTSALFSTPVRRCTCTADDLDVMRVAKSGQERFENWYRYLIETQTPTLT